MLGLHASTRFYEVMISGRAMLLCDRNPAALDPLGIVEGVHAAMFNSSDEFERKVLYYTRPEHEAERRALVGAARALALQRHTWRMRGELMAREMRSTLSAWRSKHGAAEGAD